MRLLILALFLLTTSHLAPAAAQTTTTPQPAQSADPQGSDDDLINPDRPGIADGSAVIGAHRFQVESGFQQEYRRGVGTRQQTLFIPMLLRIGISRRWEARVEWNTFTRVRDFNLRSLINQSSGLAPISFGFKYQLQDSKGVKHPSLGMIVRVFPAWGTNDFRAHHVTGDVRLAADWDFAPRLKLSLNPNVGLGVYEDGLGREYAAGLVAATLTYAHSRRLNPFVDFGLQVPERKGGKSSLIVDAGVAYIVGRNVQLDASVGTGAHGQTPPHPFISCGVSFRLNNILHR